tara:strand:+ start:2644 stop:4011 length:1368 start_codon:yes stop_codon:yes gene_type:complete
MIKVDDNLNNYSKLFNYYFFTIITAIIIVFPKINILPIPGYWQGVQLPDILLLFFLLFLILNSNNLKINSNLPFTNLYIFLFYFIFISFLGGQKTTNVHGVLSFNTSIIILIRFFEYLVFTVLCLNYFNNKKIILVFCKFFIIINCIFAILQEFNLIGYVNSRGFYPPGDPGVGGRSMGITGGPWELGATTSLAFFSIYILSKTNRIQILFYLVLTVISLFLAETKGNIVAFLFCLPLLVLNKKNIIFLGIISLIFFLYIFANFLSVPYFIILIILFLLSLYLINKSISEVIIYILGILFILYFFDAYLSEIYFIKMLMQLDLFYLLKTTFNFIVYEITPSTNDTPNLHLYYSFILRLNFWLPMFVEFKSNTFNWLFGMGNQYLYYESMIFRIILSYGLIGTLLILFLIRKIPVFLLFYSLLAGFTFDLFFSSKVFFMGCILMLSINYFKNHKIN